MQQNLIIILIIDKNNFLKISINFFINFKQYSQSFKQILSFIRLYLIECQNKSLPFDYDLFVFSPQKFIIIIDKINPQKMIQNLYKPRSSYDPLKNNKRPTIGDRNNNQFSPIKHYNTKEEDIQLKKKLDLTTLDLFLWKASKTNQQIQSTFKLIQLTQNCIPSQNVTIENLLNYNFPVLKYQVKDLIEFSIKILRTTQFCNSNFTQRVTKKLVTLLAKNYNAVSYHNFSHAFYFTMLVFQCFNRQFTLKHICTDQQYFYILAAGFCHDLNHNGSTNSFQIKTQSHLAKQVKNQSVLQNMHLRHLWKILDQNPDLNFITPSKDKKKAKEIVTRLILSTDMAFHSRNLQNFRNTRRLPNFDMKKNSEHKWMAIQQVFHACDIGNPCTDYNNYIAWGALLSHQFNFVAKQQKKLKLQVTKCFEMTTIQSVYKDQIWFISCLVQPIWKELGQVFPSLELMNSNIDKNLKRVKQELQKLKR